MNTQIIMMSILAFSMSISLRQLCAIKTFQFIAMPLSIGIPLSCAFGFYYATQSLLLIILFSTLAVHNYIKAYIILGKQEKRERKIRRGLYR